MTMRGPLFLVGAIAGTALSAAVGAGSLDGAAPLMTAPAVWQPAETGTATLPRPTPEPPTPELLAVIEQRRAERAELRQREAEERRQARTRREERRAQTAARDVATRHTVGALVCAHTTAWCDTTAARADALLPGWSHLGWDLHVSDDPPDDWLGGLASPTRRTVTVFPDDTWTTVTLDGVLAHEFGHAIDHQFWDEPMRERWRQDRGIDPEVPWRAGGWPHDHSAAGEDLAEVVAWLITGGRYLTRSPYPTPDEKLRDTWEDHLLPSVVRGAEEES